MQIIRSLRGRGLLYRPTLLLKSSLRSITKIPKICDSVLLRIRHQTNYRRWSQDTKLEAWWDSRTEKIAGFIPHKSRVIEFGAGRGVLRQYLDSSIDYIPSDIVARDHRMVVCDLNSRPLPDIRPLSADVAVFAGVLEYLVDLPFVVRWLANEVSTCVASYKCKDGQVPHEMFDRLSFGYMNHYTEEQLLSLFAAAGFTCIATDIWTDQRIFVFKNSRAT